MFDPTTLATEMSGWPRSAANRATVSSGADVPSATTQTPTTASGSPKR